ncbi:MAG: DUF2125 domain-containing protein [Pseudomonadota bacterium]
MIRRLTIIALVAALLWGGYWAVGSVALDRALRAWIADRQGEGWVAEYADLSVRGFPNRFDTTFTDLDLADPDTGLAWSLPFFQILALSYQPNHVIAVWPDTHQIATPAERLTITSDKMQASLVVEPGTDLVLDRTTLVAEALGVTSSRGWNSGAANLSLASRQVEGPPNTYDIAVEATDVILAEPARSTLDPLRALPGEVKTLRLLTKVTFDRPWDRFAVERARPQPTRIEITDLTALWGNLELRAAGAIDVTDTGRATGEVTVKAVNWKEMLDIAVAAGVLADATRQTAENALSLLAGLSGRADTIDAPLTIRDSLIFFGPIPLGRLDPIALP